MIQNAELKGRIQDVRINARRILEIAGRLAPENGEECFDADGGALLPGLHDHHIHLLSLAASLESISCGPPEIMDLAALQSEIQSASNRLPDKTQWLRGSGYFESVAGDLDRHRLDALCPDRPIRIQHRNGSMWFLNSLALEWIGLDYADASRRPPPPPAGVERDASGRATGRIFRLDDWLRDRLPAREEIQVTTVGSLLASFGVTGITDATPTNGPSEVNLFRKAQANGSLPQRLVIMGAQSLSGIESDSDLSIGAFKILLDEPTLPNLDDLVESIRIAHSSHRTVAIHCVTRSEIHFAIAASFFSAGFPE